MTENRETRDETLKSVEVDKGPARVSGPSASGVAKRLNLTPPHLNLTLSNSKNGNTKSTVETNEDININKCANNENSRSLSAQKGKELYPEILDDVESRPGPKWVNLFRNNRDAASVSNRYAQIPERVKTQPEGPKENALRKMRQNKAVTQGTPC
ncbi:hypothetical protein K7X08_035528 [Anisodus acutangulus]|uniref:Uncharacterized protein n=1 Tax=Anisodus acutangulus TaxID=402998 RepID=A0A9Q1LHE5_9SOLA|nr:hypothetical protein K7X08_035528 [Anisodus acutangulus]